MIRGISIVMIAVIAMQTVGCSSWRPLTRANEVPEHSKQALMRDQVLGKLTEGMVVRIEIRESSRTPIRGQVIEGLINRVGLKTLTVTHFKGFAVGEYGPEYTLSYADIVSIEYRQVRDLTVLFLVGAVVGTLAGFFGTGIIVFEKQEFEKTEESNLVDRRVCGTPIATRP